MNHTWQPKFVYPLSFVTSTVVHAVILGLIFSSRLQTNPPSQITVETVDYRGTSLRAHPTAKLSKKNISKKKQTAVLSQHSVNPTVEPYAIKPQGEAANSAQLDSPAILGTSIGLKINYPRLSRQLGEQGQVLIEIRKYGNNLDPKISRSSGYPRLDNAALLAIHDGIKNDQLLGSLAGRDQLRVSFIFKLTPGDSVN